MILRTKLLPMIVRTKLLPMTVRTKLLPMIVRTKLLPMIVRTKLLPMIVFTVLPGVILSADARPAASEDKTWHAETLSSSPRGVHVTQYWARNDDHLRAETVIAGHRLVTIVAGDTYYAVDVNKGQAIAVKRSKRSMEKDRWPRLVGTEGFVIRDRGGELVKTERLAGQKCDVWRLTDGRGRREVWVQADNEEMLPLRVEVYNRQAAAEVRTDYTQWATGLEVPDRMFLPDPRFEIEQLSYEDYVKRSGEGASFPPVLHANLLHGER